MKLNLVCAFRMLQVSESYKINYSSVYKFHLVIYSRLGDRGVKYEVRML